MISDRLKAIAEHVNHQTVADIGTDHAYLPIFLVKNMGVTRCAACDLNKGPLLLASKNILKHGLTDIITTRLSNGLDKITENEFETLIIAGMGGSLMIDILSKNLKTALSFQQMIFQPQSEIHLFRQFILKNGLTIEAETTVKDGGKFYFILNCSSGKGEDFQEHEFYYGKHINAIMYEYLLAEEKKLLNLFASIKNESRLEDLKHKLELNRRAQNDYKK